jgi:LDH2 family malate/lactate/ureidoglycolate dehydrogenase
MPTKISARITLPDEARRLPGLLKAIGDGRVKAVPHIRLLREHGATCLLDGDICSSAQDACIPLF